MSVEIVLSIVGGFGTLALGVNAFFLRGIFQDLNGVKISIAKMVENSASKERRIEDLEREMSTLRDRFHAINTELHQIKSLELFRDGKEK